MSDEAYIQNLLGELAAQRDAALNQLASAVARAKTLEQEMAKMKQGEQEPQEATLPN